MTRISSDNLERLIRLVDAKIAAAGDTRELDYREARRQCDEILDSLVQDEGAVVTQSCGAYHLTLGRVKTSCTSGSFGLLRNWKVAARRKIDGIVCRVREVSAIPGKAGAA